MLLLTQDKVSWPTPQYLVSWCTADDDGGCLIYIVLCVVIPPLLPGL